MRSLLLSSLIVLAVTALSCKKDGPTTQQEPIVTVEELQHTVLIEPTVSVGCGACPLAHHRIEVIEAENDQVTHMTHYLYGPLFHPYSKYLLDKIDKTVYTPLGHVDRRHEDSSVVYYPVNMFEGIVGSEIEESTAIGLTLSTLREVDMIDLAVTVSTEAQDLQKELRITVVIVEKEVTGEGSGYDQRNYGHDDPDHPYYQQGESIEGFVHTNVIRDVLTPFEGEAIDLSSGSAEWSVSISTQDLGSEPSAYSVIAFVTEGGENVQPILNTVIGDLSE